MHAILDRQCRDGGQRTFVRMGDDTLTFDALASASKALASTLVGEFRLRKGERVAVLMANCLDYFVVQFAVSRAGGVLVPLNTMAKGEILANILNNCEPAVIVADEGHVKQLRDCGSPVVGQATLLVRGAGNEGPVLGAPFSGRAMRLEDAIENGSPDTRLPVVSWSDPVDIFYTSGSTGEAKGVMLAHNHHYVFGTTIIQANEATSDDVTYICLPLYHGMGSYMSIMPMLLAGGSIALADRFSASRWLEDIRYYGATITWAVNSLAAIITKQPARDDDADNPLRIYNYIGMPPDLLDRFERRFDVHCVEHFGSTEVGHLAFTHGERPAGYIGRINDTHYDVRVVDENDVELPRGSVGECVSRPREPFIQMIGYYRNPEATLQVLRNCWMHSGDLCRINEDGYVQYVGRNKDMIRRRGENIPSHELEKLLFSYSNVADCAAIPVPSELGEDEIKLVFCLRKRSGDEIEHLIEYCREELPGYMFPQYIEIIEEMPRLPNEKLDKQTLRENWATSGTYDVQRQAFLEGTGA